MKTNYIMFIVHVCLNSQESCQLTKKTLLKNYCAFSLIIHYTASSKVSKSIYWDGLDFCFYTLNGKNLVKQIQNA